MIAPVLALGTTPRLSDALKFDDSHATSEQQHLAKAIDR